MVTTQATNQTHPPEFIHYSGELPRMSSPDTIADYSLASSRFKISIGPPRLTQQTRALCFKMNFVFPSKPRQEPGHARDPSPFSRCAHTLRDLKRSHSQKRYIKLRRKGKGEGCGIYSGSKVLLRLCQRGGDTFSSEGNLHFSLEGSVSALLSPTTHLTGLQLHSHTYELSKRQLS